MRKESSVLIFGTALSILSLIVFKGVHFYMHGLCRCLPGKLFEYAIPGSGFVAVILLTNKAISKLIRQRESESEKLQKAYETIPLYDIGKVGILDRILLKPGKLMPDEMAVMKTHTLIGAEILKGPDFLKMGMDIAHYHHEKWDGSGYPDGIKGENIPLSARIMALADVYDALVSKRVYKEAFTHEMAESIIKEGIGSHFDPDVGAVFMEHSRKFVEISKNFSGKSIKMIYRREVS